MIDKLELRLPALTAFQREVREFMLEARHFHDSTRAMPAKRYEWRTDLRPIGRDVILHYGLKRPEGDMHSREHKLEILDTGKKSYSELAALLDRTIQVLPDDLEIMRIDLCADIHGVPIAWFLPRARVKFKRYAHEIGEAKYQRIGTRGIETICAGKRPNMVRFYDKVAECEMQLKRLQRKQSRDADTLTLESEFGIIPGSVITRVERQYGGNRIPREIGTFNQLAQLPQFDPFTNIEIVNGTGVKAPTVEECGLDTWLAGTRLAELHAEMGEQQFRRFLSRHSSGNAARIRKKYRDFLATGSDHPVTPATLRETFCKSVTEQLAA